MTRVFASPCMASREPITPRSVKPSAASVLGIRPRMTTRLPTRAEILDLLGSDARPMHVREIASRLRVSEVDYLGLERLLDSLSLEGVLTARPGSRFKLVAEGRSGERDGRGRDNEARGPADGAPARVRLRGQPQPGHERRRRLRPAGCAGRRPARRQGARPHPGPQRPGRRGRGRDHSRARHQARGRHAAPQGQERLARAGRHPHARAHRPAPGHRRRSPAATAATTATRSSSPSRAGPSRATRTPRGASSRCWGAPGRCRSRRPRSWCSRASASRTPPKRSPRPRPSAKRCPRR